jgi:hypothetical protein
MSEEFIFAAFICAIAAIYLVLGAILANILGVEDTLLRIGVVLLWPIVVVFLVVLVMIGVRVVGATANAIRGRT